MTIMPLNNKKKMFVAFELFHEKSLATHKIKLKEKFKKNETPKKDSKRKKVE